MSPHTAHTPAELAELECSTGLRHVGWLDAGDGGPLLPILGHPGQAAELARWRRRVLALNGRASAAPVEAAQVEPGPPAAA